MSKQPPTLQIVHRRASLQEMVERGTRHEAEVAAAKLAKLEARYDFAAESAGSREDLFSMCGKIKAGRADYVHVISISAEDEEIGSYVKWAFLHRFGVDSYWKKAGQGASMLHANVDNAAAASLRSMAEVIISRFKQLWVQFSERNTLRAEQRRPFFCGLYDGMMQSPRRAGERIPMLSGSRRKRKKGAKTSASSVETHPYEVGMALGAMIRVNTPLRMLSAQLRIMMEPQSGN